MARGKGRKTCMKPNARAENGERHFFFWRGGSQDIWNDQRMNTYLLSNLLKAVYCFMPESGVKGTFFMHFQISRVRHQKSSWNFFFFLNLRKVYLTEYILLNTEKKTWQLFAFLQWMFDESSTKNSTSLEVTEGHWWVCYFTESLILIHSMWDQKLWKELTYMACAYRPVNVFVQSQSWIHYRSVHFFLCIWNLGYNTNRYCIPAEIGVEIAISLHVFCFIVQ